MVYPSFFEYINGWILPQQQDGQFVITRLKGEMKNYTTIIRCRRGTGTTTVLKRYYFVCLRSNTEDGLNH